jgi:hypothetical protein
VLKQIVVKKELYTLGKMGFKEQIFGHSRPFSRPFCSFFAPLFAPFSCRADNVL